MHYSGRLVVSLIAGTLSAGAATIPHAVADPRPPKGMVRVPGGEFRMGTRSSFAYEGPIHPVRVRPFYLDAREVTNTQFAAFVRATSYRTVAEKEGWSGVFDRGRNTWGAVDGATWQHPEGPKSSIRGRSDYPVLQVCWFDAEAYARWAKKRLPTEAEWEFAARGGLKGQTYPWGNTLDPGGRPAANYWQGVFPQRDLTKDGFAEPAPGGKFPVNGYGLFDMAGNVWEWVADRFGADYYQHSPKANPTGPTEGKERVMRGGSYLCATNYCAGFRVAARNKNPSDTASNNIGFRCAADVPR